MAGELGDESAGVMRERNARLWFRLVLTGWFSRRRSHRERVHGVARWRVVVRHFCLKPSPYSAAAFIAQFMCLSSHQGFFIFPVWHSGKKIVNDCRNRKKKEYATRKVLRCVWSFQEKILVFGKKRHEKFFILRLCLRFI